MNLRQVKALEFEVVYDILYENAQWLLRKNIFQWPLDWLQSKKEAIKESINSGRYYAIDNNNEIVAVVEINSIPEGLWGNDLTSALYVHKLAIRRKVSNQNLGGKILKLIEEMAVQQGVKYLRLDCIACNAKLRQYYETYGFMLKLVVKVGDVDFALYECVPTSDKSHTFS